MDSNLDTDFNDVFGGPPSRTSSVQGTRYSFGESIMDSSSGFRTSDETVVVVPRNLWTGLSEKPVFGEEGIISRRKYSKTDFFDDIFGGNESLSSSPRTSAPVSRILSPSRPLPPKAKPFATSFPSQLSLPVKLNKGMDHPISNGSSNFAHSPISRLPGQENQDKNQEIRGDYQGNTKEDSNSSEISGSDVNRFHFSIYKWANKGGVPFDIPLRGSHRFKQKGNLQRCISANDLIASGNIAMEQKETLHNNFSSTDRMSSNDKNEYGSPIDSKNKVDEPVRIIEENSIPKIESESLCKSTGEVVLPGSKADKYKPRTKPPNLVFDYGNNDEPGNDEITKGSDISEKNAEKLSETLDGVDIKKQNMNKRATSNNVEASTTSLRKSHRKSWDKGKSRARGNVRDFIKIFNQDAAPKPRADVISENRSSGLKQRHGVKPETKTSISMNGSEEKIQRPNIQKKKKSSDVHVENHMFDGASEMNTHSPAKDTVFDGSKTISEDPVQSSEVDYSIEDLTPVPEEKTLPQHGIDPEEMQVIDAKIRQWSNGKQGNIRSLLSTLQFVLWPDSGWKPVPLADIIEGRTVKRSYQKALLCLHPDKLQQKGAASNKKYIAEKVFDILQDAWDQFNLIGSI